MKVRPNGQSDSDILYKTPPNLPTFYLYVFISRTILRFITIEEIDRSKILIVTITSNNH